MTIRFPLSMGVDLHYPAALNIIQAAAALSDAALQSVTLRYEARDTNHPPPATDSNVGFYLALYYSNETDTIAIWLPSPDNSLLETSGDFAGIRLDMGNPLVVAATDALTIALGATVSADMEVFGRSFVVGGRTR